MSNGTRHLLGAIAGIVAIPVVSALVFGGLSLTLEVYSRFTLGGPLYVATAVVAVGAVVVALLVGTRVSPLASLIPGLVFTGAAGVAAAAPRTFFSVLRELPSPEVHVGEHLGFTPFTAASNGVSTGAVLLVGVVLLAASVAPSRWRGKVRVAMSAGLHRAGPAGEEPRLPPQPERPEPGIAAGLPPEEPATVQERPYADSGPQSPYGGSGPQSAYGGSGPQSAYGGSREEEPYDAFGSRSAFGDAGTRSSSYDSGPQSAFGDPRRQTPFESGPGSRYDDSASQPIYGAPTPQSPHDSGPQSPYGGLSGEPQAPYRSAFEPPARPGAGDDFSGYAPGNQPSSWSGPQPAYPPRPGPPGPPEQPGRPPRPAGDDPYAVPPTTPTSYSPPPEQPWGPAPDADRVPPRDPFPDTPQADPARRPSNTDETTNRLPWTEDDRARFRDPRDRDR